MYRQGLVFLKPDSGTTRPILNRRLSGGELRQTEHQEDQKQCGENVDLTAGRQTPCFHVLILLNLISLFRKLINNTLPAVPVGPGKRTFVISLGGKLKELLCRHCRNLSSKKSVFCSFHIFEQNTHSN